MKFKEKLGKQFTDFNISIPNIPKHKHHLYADYIELIALFTKSHVTKSDILDRLFDEGIELSDEKNMAEKDDNNENWINEIFDLINHRNSLFSDDYPFNFENNNLKIKDRISEKNKIYLSLLISSSLNYFKLLQPELTTEFETISFQSLLNYMPKTAKVKATGENSEYSGTAKEKIKKLANEIYIKINNTELNNISKRNVKEKGLDLIAWIPFEDKIPNIITLLAQCACGKDWKKKQHETGRYENYFVFYRKRPIHAMYIPYSLTNNNSFYESDDIVGDRIIFDRKRILEFLPDTSFFNNMNSHLIVNKTIEYEEDIV